MNFNLMYSDSHITMGTSSDDLFDKSGRNQNSLHFKYNKFLISPYLERKYNNSLFETNKYNENNTIDNTKEIYPYDSIGETNIYYPKPNYYNNIYTQRFSKKYKKFYGNDLYSNYGPKYTENYEYYNPPRNINLRNGKLKKGLSLNNVKTPNYQIKKEIEIQKTPNKYYEENKFNNYKRYDDYYLNNNKNIQNGQKYNSSVISKITENNFINSEYNNQKQYFSPTIKYRRRRMYS